MPDTLVRFHLSLNVADLGTAVAFYRVLLGVEPAKVRPDYAKFEPDSPPLVLSLEPSARAVGGPLNHVGIRMPDAKALVATQARLEANGFRCNREDGVECCYAKQTKFWLHDPDGTLWEMYTLDGDIDHRGMGQTEDVVKGTAAAPAAPHHAEKVVWEHRMGEPVPDRLPLADDSADEVRLRGTFNLPLSADARAAVTADAVRALKPGGRLFVHVLTGERAVEAPQLPGPAGMVRHVPHESEPVRTLEDAGLVGVRLLKFDAKTCFVRDGVGMRETQVEGWKPVEADATDDMVEVMYRGPFEGIDDGGHSFRRGERTAVPVAEAMRFRTPELSAQFTVFEPTANRPLAATACA